MATATEGLDGFLFLDNDANKALKQTTGELLLSESRLDLWRGLLLGRAAKLSAMSVGFYTALACNKESVYHQFLPKGYTLARHRTYNQFAELAAGIVGLNFVDMYPPLCEAAATELTYYKTDTHWNDFGAYVAYLSLMQRIAKDYRVRVLPKPRFTWQDFVGDLGKMCDPPRSAPSLVASYESSATCKFINGIPNVGRVAYYENTDRQLPTCIVFGNSFTWHKLIDYIAESFSSTLFIWSATIDLKVIERFKPDVVIDIPLERFIMMPPVDDCFLGYRAVGLSKLMMYSQQKRLDIAMMVKNYDVSQDMREAFAIDVSTLSGMKAALRELISLMGIDAHLKSSSAVVEPEMFEHIKDAITFMSSHSIRRAYYIKGLILYLIGDRRRAEHVLRDVSKYDSSNATGMLARIYLDSNRYDELSELLASAPASANVLAQILEFYVGTPDIEPLRLVLTRFIEAGDTFADMLMNTAFELYSNQRHAAALALLDVLLLAQPDNCDAYNDRGVMLFSLGRVEEARESFARAISLDNAFDAAIDNYKATFRTG